MKTSAGEVVGQLQVPPEAELEAMLSAALAKAFPSVPRRDFAHQKRFSITLGHETHEVEGTRLWKAAGRADIILLHKNRPLAVLELKRADLSLTDDDRRQGQSYANQLTPRPPLVIVTNGIETRLFDSSNGEIWVPETAGGEIVAKLFENAAKVAASNLHWAVEVLMGPDFSTQAAAQWGHPLISRMKRATSLDTWRVG